MAPPPSSDGPLRGRVAVVTGASRGIGLATARALAEAGCALALAARRSTPGPWTADTLTQQCDITREEDVAAFFSAVKERFGRVDVLVNNAGMSHAIRNVDELSLGDWRRNLDTNLTGMFLCT